MPVPVPVPVRRRFAGQRQEVRSPPGSFRRGGADDAPSGDDHELLRVALAVLALPWRADRPQHAVERIECGVPCRRTGAVIGHHDVGRGQDAAGGGAGAEGRADGRGRLERQLGEQGLADEERGPSGVVPRGLESRADLVGREVGADVGHLARAGAEDGQAPPLVELRLGAIDLEPPRRGTAESEGAAVVAGPEQHDLGDPVADGTGHLGVDEARPLQEPGPASERHSREAAHVTVEGELRVGVPFRGRGSGARQAGALSRDPAGGHRRSSRARAPALDQEATGLAPAPACARARPRRSER